MQSTALKKDVGLSESRRGDEQQTERHQPDQESFSGKGVRRFRVTSQSQ
jgi:hypothetical protein